MAGFPQKTGASALQSRASKYMRRAIVLRCLPCPWLGSFSGHVESYTAEEETPSSTAKALHVLPSRDYQSPIARRSDGKYLYSRTLAYVFLQDGTHLNAEIICQGYGFAVSSSLPLKYQNEFRRLEREAREQRRGLWAIATKGNDG
jgi:hypothetical protein